MSPDNMNPDLDQFALPEDKAPREILEAEDLDVESVESEDPTALPEYDTSLEALQELLDAEDSADIAAEAVTLPAVSWAADNLQPDYSHSLTAAVGGLALKSQFDFDARVFELLVRANHFKPRGKNGLVAFGLRGGKMIGADKQEDVQSVQISDARPDHKNFQCTIGIYDTTTKTLKAYSASTVPNEKWMQNYYKIKNGIRPHKSTRSNLLPTGCYVYRVNAHSGGTIKPALRMTDPDNLKADGVCTVLRTHNDLTYTNDDLWDRSTPYDNIHCAYSSTSFSSAGCQTIKGADGQGPWSAFQDVIRDLGWDARIDYMLLSGRDAAIAAAIIAAGREGDEALVQATLGRLRVGSEGERVTALQKKLGFNGSAYFGPSTKKRLVEAEATRGLASDGVYSPTDDLETGWGVFRVPAPQGAAASKHGETPIKSNLNGLVIRVADALLDVEGRADAITFLSSPGADAMQVNANVSLQVAGSDAPLRISAEIAGIPALASITVTVAAVASADTPMTDDRVTKDGAARAKHKHRTITPKLSAQSFDSFAPNARAGYRDAMLAQGHQILGPHGIDRTPRRLAHFLAQLSHESGGFQFRTESLNYTTAERIKKTWPKRFPTVGDAASFVRNEEALAEKVYSGRMGNTQAGDGFKYRGRGLIQLTGRKNYQEYSERLNVDLVGNPDTAFDPVMALRIAAEYWAQRKLRGERPMNALADDDKLRALTYRINGGFTNFEHREAELAKAKAIWGHEGGEISKIVDRGDFSDGVRRLQLALVSLGRLSGTVDGKFGFNTYKALFAFKSQLGLVGAGHADAATFAALESADFTESFDTEDAGPIPVIGDDPEAIRNGVSLAEEELMG